MESLFSGFAGLVDVTEGRDGFSVPALGKGPTTPAVNMVLVALGISDGGVTMKERMRERLGAADEGCGSSSGVELLAVLSPELGI